MQLTSKILKDETSSNALHKLVTKYAHIHDPIYPDFLRQMQLENEILLAEFRKRELPKITLELGSGTARQSWLLRKSLPELEVHALELSTEMAKLGVDLGRDYVMHGDARNFSCSEKVGAIIYGANTCCYFQTNEDFERALECTYNSLHLGGLVLIDFLPAKTMIQDLTTGKFSKQVFKVKEGRITRFNESQLDLTRCVKWRWDATYLFELNGSVSTDTDDVELRAFFPSEIERFLTSAEFKPIKTLGYDGDSLEALSNSGRYSSIVCLAEKAA